MDVSKLTLWRVIQQTVAVLTVMASFSSAQETITPASVAFRQSLDDAWWTGPLLAPSASTLPRGHFLMEPYFYDVAVQGRYDLHGVRRPVPHSNGFGSLTYMLYGLADKVTVGLIPTAGFNQVSGGLSSSGIGMGDLTLQAQYRLTQFHERGWIPTTALAVQETLPTGRYDQLGSHPSDGLGGGAFATTLAFYSQSYFWLPTGRILRMRFNVLPTFSSNVNLRDVSVYGTGEGFRGHAKPGNSIFVDAALEYSVTRKWVLALDATYRYQGNTAVRGYTIADAAHSSVRLDSRSGDAFGFAPAIEYNWKRNLGVIVGTRLIGPGRNTSASITPVMAINYVH